MSTRTDYCARRRRYIFSLTARKTIQSVPELWMCPNNNPINRRKDVNYPIFKMEIFLEDEISYQKDFILYFRINLSRRIASASWSYDRQ